MIFESVEKMFKIKSILTINSLILLVIVKNILSGTIRTEYNFGNQQNPEIDKSFNHVLGSNVYFVTEAPEKSMYITAIYPSLTLEVKLKIYTDDSRIINAFNNGDQIYFGFDLLIENIDKEEPNSADYDKYNTDIMICIFSKTDVECHDYVKKDNDEYLLNDGGGILLNNLIPLGFKNIDLNFIQENVIGFKSYFSVKFEKEYPPLFDNITMFNWINYVAADTGEGVIGFYGILDSSINSINDIANSKNIPLYSKMLDFVDGTGLEEDNLVFLKIKSFFLILIIFLIIL
jgi:hypothetical protein